MRTVKQWLSAMLSFCLLLACTGCQSEQDEIYSAVMSEINADESTSQLLEIDYDSPDYIGPKPDESAKPTPIPGDTLSGTLLIKSFREHKEFPEITWLAKEFMELHPGVEIQCEFDFGFWEERDMAEITRRQDAFYSRLGIELASGEADYLLWGLAEDLDYSAFMRSGVLTDFRTFWESDPDIHEEGYFMEVIEAFDVNGQLPILAYGFNITGLYFDRAIMDELGVDTDSLVTVNSDELLTWYEQARKTHPDLQLLFTSPGKDTLFRTERVSYIDLETKSANFASPEFAAFLERTRNVLSGDPDLNLYNELGHGSGIDMNESIEYRKTGKLSPYITIWPKSVNNRFEHKAMAKPALAVEQELQLYDIAHSTQQPFEHVVGPFPFVSTDGHLVVTAGYGDNFAMPSCLKNKELAWEFIKYCFSERKDLTFDRFGYTSCHYYLDPSIPVNKANYCKMADDLPTFVKSGFVYEYLFNEFDPVDGEELLKSMEEILTMKPTNPGKYNVDVQDYLDEFYINELTTPEQCAEKVQGRAEIWLNE